jgi:hypothetical protein
LPSFPVGHTPPSGRKGRNSQEGLDAGKDDGVFFFVIQARRPEGELVMSVVSELITNMGHSTEQGFFGVTAIYVYMAIIVVSALYRIRKMAKEHH